MIGAKLQIEGELEVLTPLHIGSGEFRVAGPDFSNEGNTDGEGEIATVIKDLEGKPCIPGSSLKGVMRTIFQHERLFGPASVEGVNDARSGKLVISLGKFSGVELSKGSGFQNRAGTDVEKGLFVDTHIAKDGASGVVDTGLLFRREKVMPGARFRVNFSLNEPEDSDCEALARLIARMCTSDGFELGKGTRAGNGRVRLKRDSLETSIKPTRAIWLNEIKSSFLKLADAAAVEETEPDFVLSLTCDAPFLIADPQRKRRQGDNTTPQIGALLSAEGTGARLSGETLLGALRARFETFCNGRTDNLDQSDWLPPRAIDRLFGTTDWKGRVCISSLEDLGTGTEKPVTSVKLDRFSGAPIDGALFTMEGWINCGFKLGLRLEGRPVDGTAKKTLEEDNKLFGDFIKHLSDPVWGGLELGHSTNSGFGWFNVEEMA